MGAQPAGGVWQLTSARTGAGITALQRAVIDHICGTASEADTGHVVTSERHRSLLDQAAAALARAASGVAVRLPTEVLAFEIREAAQSLAAFTGEQVGEEVLDSLFSRFCIGK
jgi:tRNA modification GTPase